MKKKIIICVFSALILITAIYTIVSAIESYHYDMDPANGADILEGIGAAIIILIGGFTVFYELDLFYTVYYFFIKPKTIAKTILNILSNFSLLLIFFSDYLIDFFYKHFNLFKEDYLLPIFLFLIYVFFRMIYLIVSELFDSRQSGS